MTSFSEIAVSAPSKMILHGEHSVVYGKTAVATSLDLRTRMVIKPNQGNRIKIDFPDIDCRQEWSIDEVKDRILVHKPSSFSMSKVDKSFLETIDQFLKEDEENVAISSMCFFYLYAIVCDEAIAMDITVESEIPIGAGLGSSAALSVCLAAGLLNIKSELCPDSPLVEDHSHFLRNRRICELAFLSEEILHGSASGVDNSVSTYGGVIKFVSGAVTRVNVAPRMRILLANTNVSRNTKKMVEKVRLQALAMPSVIQPMLEAMDGISNATLSILEEMAEGGDTKDRYEELGSLIDYNQKLLEALQISHPKIEEICSIAKKHGLHAKLTGAGGGGFAFILVPPFVNDKIVRNIRAELSENGFKCWETNLGVNGVHVQRQNNIDLNGL